MISARLSTIFNPCFVDFHKKVRNKEFLKDLTSPAIRTMKELLNANSDYVRFQAAQDILDRTGYKANERLDMSIDMPTIISGEGDLLE